VITVLDTPPLDIESIPQASAIEERFHTGFEAFLQSKKQKAVAETLQKEIRSKRLSQNKDFTQRVMARLADEALVEEPFVFLSVNPYLEELFL
jgi:hypothetical protein